MGAAPAAGAPALDESRLRSDQGLRIESLGDNCELGFVLRRLGHEGGSLFRWTAIKPPQLLAMLRDGLEDFYRFDDLEPLRTSMVLDRRYGVGWHSEMRCRPEGHRMAFVHDEALRRKTHLRETRKLRYLTSKFLARVRLGGLLHVVKCNAGIDPAAIEGIHARLRDLAGDAPFALLEVRASDDPALAGTVTERAPGLLRGFVPGFAPYDAADTGDFACWTAILDRALEMVPGDDWTRRLAGLRVAFADSTVQLAFPLGADHDLGRPIAADLRAGAGVLHNGGAWCRPFGGAFRLHGPAPDAAGAELHWTGVCADGPRQLGASLRCAVEDSVPVDVVVTVRDGAGATVARQSLTVGPERPEEIVTDLPAGLGRPLDIRLVANASRPLRPGERAVADLSPPALYPAA